MAEKTKSKKSTSDFLKESGKEEAVKITGKEVYNVASLKNDTARKVVGFLLLTFSLVLFVSFVSFFFSWKTDQSFLVDGDWDLFKQNHGEAENAMGYIGAKLAFTFVHNGFGLAAFFLLPYLTFGGLFLLLNYKPFSLLRIVIHTLLFTVWFSLFLGFGFQKWFPLLGGTFGYFGIQQLQESIGIIGVILFLVGFAVVYGMIFHQANPFSRLVVKEPIQEEQEEPIAASEFQPSIREDDPRPEKETTEIEDLLDDVDIENTDEFTADIVEENIEDDVKKKLDLEVVEPFEEEVWNGMNITMKRLDEEESIEIVVPQEEETIEPPLVQNETKEEEPIVFEFTTKRSKPNAEPVIPTEPNNIPQEESNFDIEVHTHNEEDLVEENLAGKHIEHYGIDTEYDPKANLSGYKFPTLDLLREFDNKKQEIDVEDINKSKKLIEETLNNYKIGISNIKASVGPTVTLYEIIPAPGVKISKIKNLEDDIALSLAALGIRIIAPIPGKGTIGIEVPNRNPEMVPMRGVLASKKFQECDFQLPVVLGKTISNEIFIADLAKMPHLLMAGATGQGKSVGLNAILVSLLYKKHPAYIKFVLVDPKKVELTLYNKIERHFLAKLPGEGDAIITDNQKVIHTLNSLCIEMDNRYKLLQDALVRNIVEYNGKFLDRKLNPQNGHRFMPYIIVVIDEVADLIMTAGKEIEIPIARLAQLARAIGIHLILATQRPSVNVITGMIKANFPARIAFRVTSKIDSRTILDGNGADQLIGKGDMLYSGGNEMIRLQCPFVDTPEVERIVDFIGEQRAYSTAYILPEVQEENASAGGDFDAEDRDPMFEDAARIIVQNQVGSTSMIQRKMKIGYNRAGRLMDQMEDAGVVGPNLGSKPRQVLIPDEYALEQFLNNLM